MRITAGSGYMMESPMQLHFRDAHVALLGPSTNERVDVNPTFAKVTAANNDAATTPYANAFSHTVPAGWNVVGYAPDGGTRRRGCDATTRPSGPGRIGLPSPRDRGGRRPAATSAWCSATALPGRVTVMAGTTIRYCPG